MALFPILPPNPESYGLEQFVVVANNVTSLILYIAAPVAVVMIIWAAIQIFTSGGSEDKVRKAKGYVLWVVVGLAVMILSKVIIVQSLHLVNNGGAAVEQFDEINKLNTVVPPPVKP